MEVEDYNSDEIEAPQWMNAEFFAKALQHNLEKNNAIQVKHYKITPATLKGEHYAGVVFRAVVDYQRMGEKEMQVKAIIIKTMPELEGVKKELLGDSFICETEIGVYTKVIPKFEKILRAAGDESVFGPRCLYTSLSPHKVIVLEDLVPLGYLTVRDREGNLEEVREGLLKLAKWHAVGYKIAEEDPTYFDEFRHGLLSETHMLDHEFCTSGLKFFIAMLDTEPGLVSFKPYFVALQRDLVKQCIDSFREYHDQPQLNGLNALCHGDFHVKNLMFARSETTGKVADMLLLDYQLTYFGPMVTDVINSIYMLLNAELRATHLDELLYFYFSHFVGTLKKICCQGPLPTLHDFKQQLWRHRHFEIFVLVALLPLWYISIWDRHLLEKCMGTIEGRMGLYKNKKYIEELRIILPHYLHLGYFDNL